MGKARLSGLGRRVVDMAAFRGLRGRQAGIRIIARALGVPRARAQTLIKGTDWQQDPARVRLFNELRGASIDPETGIPTAEDLAKWGGIFEGVLRHSSPIEKDVQAVMKAAGHGVASQGIADRISALDAGTLDTPSRLDTAAFLSLTEERLYWVLKLMTPDLLAKAGLRDLSQAASMLFEKRSLQRGEPTAIVRSEHRGDLARVSALLLAEMKRRGLAVEGAAAAIEAEGKAADD